jgi:hypothetical protein
VTVAENTAKVEAYRRALVLGHEDLYQTSTEFHYTIDLLARTLPHMVNGLAEHAVTVEHAYAEYRDALAQRALPTPLVPQWVDADGIWHFGHPPNYTKEER